MAVKLKRDISASDYREFKRLTQKLNRRIKAHMADYEKGGYKTIPKELTARLPQGPIQHRSQFIAGQKTPLSRGLGQFSSTEDFKKTLNLYRRLADDFNGKSAIYMDRVTEYRSVQQEKLKQAFLTAGLEPPKNISSMSTTDIKNFWSDFQERGARKMAQYSSEAVLSEFMGDYKGDLQNFINQSIDGKS